MYQASTQQPAEMSSRVWLPGIVTNIARFLSPNDIACLLRSVDRSTRQQFEGFTTVKLSLPSPAHVFKRRWGSPSAFRGLTLQQRLNLLCLTAASGHLPNLEVALENAGVAPIMDLLKAAAKGGQLEACKLLRQRGCVWGHSLEAAAQGGHRHVCEWMLASGCPLTLGAVTGAARGGHEGLMQWLLQRLREVNGNVDVHGTDLRSTAAKGLGLAALQRLYQQERLAGEQLQQNEADGGDGTAQQAAALTESQKSWTLAHAAGSPTSDWQAKVEWLEGLGFPRTEEACDQAAATGPAGDAVGRLQWLSVRGYPVKVWTATMAVRQGDLAALQFLVEQAGVQLMNVDFGCAAEQGRLELLHYAHKCGYPFVGSDVAYAAATGGHLSVVVWAVEALGVTPDNTPELLDDAATSGSVELLTWLRERGWAVGSDAVTSAVRSGCEEALEWVVEQGGRLPVDGAPYIASAFEGDLAMLRCLRRLSCPWGRAHLLAYCATLTCHLHALRLLLELGCPVDWNGLSAAAEGIVAGEYRTVLLEWVSEESQRHLHNQNQQQQQ